MRHKKSTPLSQSCHLLSWIDAITPICLPCTTVLLLAVNARNHLLRCPILGQEFVLPPATMSPLLTWGAVFILPSLPVVLLYLFIYFASSVVVSMQRPQRTVRIEFVVESIQCSR